MEYAKAMTNSRDFVDERLINLYRIRSANRHSNMIGVNALRSESNELLSFSSRRNKRNSSKQINDEELSTPRSSVSSVNS